MSEIERAMIRGVLARRRPTAPELAAVVSGHRWAPLDGDPCADHGRARIEVSWPAPDTSL